MLIYLFKKKWFERYYIFHQFLFDWNARNWFRGYIRVYKQMKNDFSRSIDSVILMKIDAFRTNVTNYKISNWITNGLMIKFNLTDYSIYNNIINPENFYKKYITLNLKIIIEMLQMSHHQSKKIYSSENFGNVVWPLILWIQWRILREKKLNVVHSMNWLNTLQLDEVFSQNLYILKS